MPEADATRMALSGFALSLVRNSQIDEDKVRQALKQAAEAKLSFISFLTQQDWVPQQELVQAISKYFALPLLDIEAFEASLVPLEMLNAPFVEKRIALPLMKRNGNLFLAVTDPTLPALNDIKFITGLNLRLIVVVAEQFNRCIETIHSAQLLSGLGDLDDEKLNELNVSAYEEEENGPEELGIDIDAAPIVRYVNKVLLDAINKGASDIHFEPYEDYYRIRFRVDGILQKIATPPARLAPFLVARIKVMSNLNTAERRVPQDGRFKLTLSRTRSVDFRVSSCPTLFGEKIVMRLLAPAQALPGIESLGMEPKQQQDFQDALEHSQGIILVSGPTGSGKTVTLYTALNILNTMEDNISTVEDPVEIPVAGINQVHVNQKTGMTFASALRSFLRQDPDVIMVGEIRDIETAEIAVKAAQTGHLVLSTVHTNSATETIMRLVNMGVEAFNIASSLILIIAQRLTRRLCEKCKQPEQLADDLLIKEGFKPEEVAAGITCYKAVGCDHCFGGYKGRIGIFEVLPISPEMIELILANVTVSKMVAQARSEGVISLRESGLQKVKRGLTSLDELNRVFRG
ncbi:MAG: type secretory protein GspE [Gammaproteobacteria bacterium]|jgi:type IV pilus assembly protein PilB|nr:type secretory protein GspE [Gammaproteobacteria bacterium]